jgi:hypothetical protein
MMNSISVKLVRSSTLQFLVKQTHQKMPQHDDDRTQWLGLYVQESNITNHANTLK